MSMRGKARTLARWIAEAKQMLVAALPLYGLALWSYVTRTLSHQSSEFLGWMTVLWPILLVPPLIAWASVAVPLALAAAIPGPAARTLAVLVALLGITFWWTSTAGATGWEAAPIGTLSPALFVLGICLAVAIGFALRRRESAYDAG